MTRITNNIMVNDFNSNYKKSSQEMNKYMNQLSTGKKFSRVSEAALDATRALKLKTTIKFNKRYANNIETGVQWLSTTDQALDDTVKTLRQVRDLAVKGANGTMTANDKQKLQEEVDQTLDHLVQIGNSKYGDRYIFNGTKTKVKPYQNGNTTISTDYQANGAISTDQLQREISQSITTDINVSGTEVGNGGFSQILADLKQLSTDLAANNTAGIESTIGKIDQHIEATLSARAGVGARQQRLEMTQSRLESQQINYNKILSETEDVDIAETIMKLKNKENVHRAALATGARVIQPTLMDFLK